MLNAEHWQNELGDARPWRISALALLALSFILEGLVAGARAAPPRYVAMLANGQRIEGEKLSDWHDKTAMPRLEGQPLLEPTNSLRWLRDRTLRTADLPLAYVELHGGDRMPGAIVDFRTGSELPYDPLPAHLVVQSSQTFEPPENKGVTEIRVALSSVRRIVWQRRGRQAYQPSTALFRDGRSLAYRAVRLQSGQVHLLLPEGGDRRIPWSDLAELHLPEASAWDAWYDELVQLCPNLETRLYQVETTAGLIATASIARLAPRFEGNSSEPDRWVHGIQPAWSLDILWVPCREIVYRRSWLPREVPLSRVPFSSADGRSNRVRAALNANSQGGPLRSGALDFGFGLGVHGQSALKFALPTGARAFRAQACLDRAAGKGGCIVARVLVNDSAGNALWQSPQLIGSDVVADTGNLALPGPANGQTHLVLAIDPIAGGRPAGADPLEIRDYANWCDPLLELDPVVVQGEFDQRLTQRFFTWKDWTARYIGAANGNEAGTEWTTVRNERLLAPGWFDTGVQVKAKPLSLTKTLTIGPKDNWLIVAATRSFSRGVEPKVEVRIGGEPVAEYVVPERQQDRDENRPVAIPLKVYEQQPAREMEVEIRQLAAADSAPVEYRSIQTAEQLPTLYCIFEDDQVARPTGSDAIAADITDDDRHYGVRSLRLGPGSEYRIPLSQPIRIRERPAWGEYRFLRFAVKKIGGGRAAIGFESLDKPDRPARYDLGRGEPSFGGATRVWQDDAPKTWAVITRDLFADFGNQEVAAVMLGAPDGEAAMFDHIYLARGHFDLDHIPLAPSAEAANEKARDELARPAIQRALPATVLIEFADGRQASGVLIQEQGEVLTAGHVLVGPNRSARVQLSNGTLHSAKTLGVAREFDLGILRIENASGLPKLDPIAPGDWPQDRLYFSLNHAPRNPEFQPAIGTAVSLRRVFRSTVWTDLSADDWVAGGPLINRDGNLIGIQSRPSQFGGILCTRFQDVLPHLARVKNGEVFGAWPPGCEPQLGIVGSAKPSGLEVTRVDVDSPAAIAGLKMGDLVSRVEGRPIAGPDDLQLALSERDAGQEIGIEFTRGGAAMQARLKLAPRVP
jgi:S1-C subfamily serine protease